MHSFQPVHVVGGGLAGGEAAWQLARRGVPVVLHEMRPLRAHRSAQNRTVWPNSSAPIHSAPTTPMNNAVGLLHEEMRRLGSLILRAADRPQASGGRRARGRPRWICRRRSPRRLAAEPLIQLAAARSRACRRRVGQTIIATGPLTSPALAEAIRDITGEECTRLLRRHRTDRASREHRFRYRLVPVAL